MSAGFASGAPAGAAYPPGWIVPSWPAPRHVHALITARGGGVSAGPYASFNLGYATGDDREAVSTNRARLRSLLPQEPRWLKQVHGTRVVEADTLTVAPEADAAVARSPGTVCAILVADCMPVLFTDRAGTRVAAAHAGWRGLAGGVIENTLATLTADGLPRTEVLAYLGAALGPAAFEVGPDVYEVFVSRHPEDAAAFAAHRPGKWHADLFALARAALRRAGVSCVFADELCTLSDAGRFYSYRRDRVTGRMAALIWRD